MSENFESLYGGSDLISSWSLIAKFRIVSEAEYNHLFRCKSEFKKIIRLTLRASICFKLVHNLLFLTTIPIKGDPDGGHCKLMTRSHGRWGDPGPGRAGDACRNIKLNLLKRNNRCALLRPENDTMTTK